MLARRRTTALAGKFIPPGIMNQRDVTSTPVVSREAVLGWSSTPIRKLLLLGSLMATISAIGLFARWLRPSFLPGGEPHTLGTTLHWRRFLQRVDQLLPAVSSATEKLRICSGDFRLARHTISRKAALPRASCESSTALPFTSDTVRIQAA